MLKKLSVISVSLLLTFVILSQVGPVRAQMFPMTSPMTPPVTSPLTTPNISMNVMGTVVYKQLGRLLNNAQRIVPAQGIIITIQNFFNPNQKATTTTDSTGKYQFQVPNGIYQITVSNGNNAFFVPPFKVVTVKNNFHTANFQGLLFPQF
jgi:hypothetical protein